MDDEDELADDGGEASPSETDLSDLPGLEEPDEPPTADPDSSSEVDYEPIDRAIGEWKDEIGSRRRGRADGAGAASRPWSSRRGCLPVLFVITAAVVVGAFVLLTFDFDSDDQQERLDSLGQSDDITAPAGDASADEGDTPANDGDAPAADMPDARVRPRSVSALTDEEGQLWFNAVFFGEWEGPLREFFSAFIAFGLTYNPSAEVGWQIHDGVETVLGDTSQAYILDNGSLLFATGLSPTPPFVLTVDARFASWEDEAGPPALFGEFSTTIDSELIEVGDPLADFGGVPVFDLVAGN